MAGAPDQGALRSEVGPGVVQDPNGVSTQQLIRENFWLRELLETELKGIVARIDASDKALELLQKVADRTPTTSDVQHEVAQLREVVMEKFGGIKDASLQLAIQTEKAASTVKEAVKDAFAASKEVTAEQNKSSAASIAKTELGFTKQIDGIMLTIGASEKTSDEKFDDVKTEARLLATRVSSIETKATSYGAVYGWVIAGVGMIVGVIGAVSYIVGMATRH